MKASKAMRRALMAAVRREWLGQEPWVVAPYRRTVEACARRGLVSEYRVTPRSTTTYYLINDAGRAEVGALPA